MVRDIFENELRNGFRVSTKLKFSVHNKNSFLTKDYKLRIREIVERISKNVN